MDGVGGSKETHSPIMQQQDRGFIRSGGDAKKPSLSGRGVVLFRKGRAMIFLSIE
jgi:hypothetical protein